MQITIQEYSFSFQDPEPPEISTAEKFLGAGVILSLIMSIYSCYVSPIYLWLTIPGVFIFAKLLNKYDPDSPSPNNCNSISKTPQPPASIIFFLACIICVVLSFVSLGFSKIYTALAVLGVIVFAMLAKKYDPNKDMPSESPSIDLSFKSEWGTMLKTSRFPENTKTIGDVAALMSAHLTPEQMGGAVPTRNEINRQVKILIAQIINYSPENIKDSDNFIKDLGMG